MNPIGITMGDPSGIGPEICAKLFAEGLDRAAFVIGDLGVLSQTAARLRLDLRVVEVTAPHDVLLAPGTLPVLSISKLPADLPIGKVDARSGGAAFDYVDRAIELAMSGEIAAIVTAPIAKEALKAAGIAFPGHTEILAAKSGGADVAMMLANDELRTILVSIHVSLAEAIRLVTRERVLRTIRQATEACRAYGIAKPRVAVAGLNPHAGESGMFGREDLDEIVPAIADARAEGIDASGPWPGDTIFMRARRGEFDIVVAQYHDQGLIPVKYLGIDHGVNVTIGLPFVRTSVDHGTAFDIAGQGKADHRSLRYAFDQAVLLARASQSGQPSSNAPEFIFMLTRNDRTIEDALSRLPEVVATGVRHIGFKDVGLPLSELHKLADAIRAAGATVYLEVVSLDADSERQSAEAAVELGVDVLMGGTRPDVVLPVIVGTGIRYYPFPGSIVGHPSVLKGTVESIVASAKLLAAMPGVHGLDLLAYRFEGDVPRLIREVCVAVDKPVVVAGSIDRLERLQAVVTGGAAGFTIGTAALDGVFQAKSPALPGQLDAIKTLLKQANQSPGDTCMTLDKVNLAHAFAKFTDHWSPKVVGDINTFQIKLAKFKGQFHWHHHDHEDELFLVVKGRLRMGFRDRNVDLEPGEFIVVPHGVEHRPEALTEECDIVLLEQNTTLNTGNVENERTVRNLERLA
jgi:4-hydroxythreonine-4-phosphate dehydrogenase